VEDVSGQVLRMFAIANPSRDKRIHAFEIVFVKFGEAVGVALGGLDEQPFGVVTGRFVI
jgi:hypothetical protein